MNIGCKQQGAAASLVKDISREERNAVHDAKPNPIRKNKAEKSLRLLRQINCLVVPVAPFAACVSLRLGGGRARVAAAGPRASIGGGWLVGFRHVEYCLICA